MKPTKLLVIIFAIFHCGCGDTGSTGKSDLAGRLKAALAVQEAGQRDEALTNFATDAADAGDGAVCLEAVSKISSTARRDLLAEDCAIRLAKAGESIAASDVANQIRDSGRRSEVNKKIAGLE